MRVTKPEADPGAPAGALLGPDRGDDDARVRATDGPRRGERRGRVARHPDLRQARDDDEPTEARNGLIRSDY